MKTIDTTLLSAPLNESLSPEKRMEMTLRLSKKVIDMVTYVICYTLVNHQDLLKNERLSVAHAFLQRSTSTHLCNHKLTTEGIVYDYKGQPFVLHEQYKTMTLTRSVYEHLAMFFYLYEMPKNAEERDIVWKYWQLNSKKNMLGDFEADDPLLKEEQASIRQEIKGIEDEILNSRLGRQCRSQLAELLKSTYARNGSIEIVEEGGRYKVNRLNYAKAWKYLYNDCEHDDLTLQYRYLSMHCHPVYDGLLQYQEQALSDQGNDAMPLYLSCSFLAYICRLFLGLIPEGKNLLRKEFGQREQRVFIALSHLPC